MPGRREVPGNVDVRRLDLDERQRMPHELPSPRLVYAPAGRVVVLLLRGTPREAHQADELVRDVSAVVWTVFFRPRLQRRQVVLAHRLRHGDLRGGPPLSIVLPASALRRRADFARRSSSVAVVVTVHADADVVGQPRGFHGAGGVFRVRVDRVDVDPPPAQVIGVSHPEAHAHDRG